MVSANFKAKKIGAKNCHYCGKLMRAGSWTWDHIVPLASGGKNRWFNRVPACKTCNCTKADSLTQCDCFDCKRTIVLHLLGEEVMLEFAETQRRTNKRNGLKKQAELRRNNEHTTCNS